MPFRTQFVQTFSLVVVYGSWLSGGITLTSVQIPTYAALGSDVTMECRYDLEGEVLYSVKWYKDGREFYQFVPAAAQESPKQAFPLPGVSVNLEYSSRNKVRLEAVSAETAGAYCCEVSGEAPNFNTISDGGDMQVVALPKEGPVINGGSTQYEIGDTADLNCTSPASNPEVQLSWTINGRPVPKHYKPHSWVQSLPNGTFVVTSHLTFRVSSEQFGEGHLKIKCIATILSMYEEWSSHYAEEIEHVVRSQPKPVIQQVSSVLELDSLDVNIATGNRHSSCHFAVLLIAALVNHLYWT